MFVYLCSYQIIRQGADDESDNGFTAGIKISGPEQICSYLLHLGNLLLGVAIFTILMAAVPSYADKMVKVEAASGLSMPVMVYVVGPAALLISGLAKVAYHATSETWKTVGGKEKWSRQQFVPKPKSKIKLRRVTIPEAEAVETPIAEFNEILETIHERNK